MSGLWKNTWRGLGAALMAAAAALLPAWWLHLSPDRQLAAGTITLIGQLRLQVGLTGLGLVVGAGWLTQTFSTRPAWALTAQRGMWILALLPVLAALRYGVTSQPLRNDTGIYLVMGQNVLRGQLPYVSIFDHKTPLTAWVTALGLALNGLTGVRWLNVILLGLLVLVTAAYARDLFANTTAGWLAGLILVSFAKLMEYTLSGPQPKLLFLLGGMTALRLAQRQRPFAAGLAGAGAFLAWQPGVIFAVLPIGIALAKGRAGLRAASWAALGAALPVLGLGTYFASHGALLTVWQQTLVFNVVWLRRQPTPFAERLLDLLGTLVRGYGREAWIVALAVVGLGFGLRWSKRSAHWMAFLVALAALLLFSVLDFQGADDGLPLLPFAAILAGWAAAQWLGSTAQPKWARALAVSGLILFVLRGTTPMVTLPQQQAEIAALNSLLKPGDRVLSINAHEALFLLNQPNAWRYYNLPNGEADYANAVEPGGLAGAIARLEANPPALVLYADPEQLGAQHPATQTVLRWIQAHYQTYSVLTTLPTPATVWIRRTP